MGVELSRISPSTVWGWGCQCDISAFSAFPAPKSAHHKYSLGSDVTQNSDTQNLWKMMSRSPYEFQVIFIASTYQHTHLSKGQTHVSGCFRRLLPYLHWFINPYTSQPPQPPSHIPTIPPFWRKAQAQELARGRGRNWKPGGSVRSNGPKPTETSAESLPGHGSSSCSTVSRAKVWGVVDFLGLKS